MGLRAPAGRNFSAQPVDNSGFSVDKWRGLWITLLIPGALARFLLLLFRAKGFLFNVLHNYSQSAFN
jgi:hypothetical protein